MRRPALVLTLIALAGRPAPGQQPYRVTWWDAASVAAATAFGVIPEAAGLPHGLPPCAPCDPSSLPGIDRAALRLKVLVHRSRPVLYTAAAPAAESDPNNRRSFPSGHAALAFAAATSYTVLAGRERLPHRTRNAVLLYAGAVGISALRVAGGKHFPTDVAGGAALGAGIGWLVATIHATVP